MPKIGKVGVDFKFPKVKLPTPERKVDALFAKAAKTLKPHPSKAEVNRTVGKLIKEIKELKTTSSTTQKLRLMYRTGKLMKRAAYATALTLAFLSILYSTVGLTHGLAESTKENADFFLKLMRDPAHGPDVTVWTKILGHLFKVGFGATMATLVVLKALATTAFASMSLTVITRLNPIVWHQSLQEHQNRVDKSQAGYHLDRHVQKLQRKSLKVKPRPSPITSSRTSPLTSARTSPRNSPLIMSPIMPRTPSPTARRRA